VKHLTQIFLCVMFLGLAACGQQMAKDLPGQPGSRVNNVNLELDRQEVVHYDCTNNVTSDKVEMVSSPISLVTISPEDSRNVVSSTFLNTDTGSTAPMLANLTTFWVDHGDGALSMHVNSGINLIKYAFYSCDQFDPKTGACLAHNTITEQGTVTMNINYTEKTLPGKLSVSDCPPPPA
jgi:hypothetical protein